MSPYSPMDPEPGLESLMARYQQGDLAAATTLVHRLSPQLRKFFAVQAASRQSADDLLQETWLRVHKVRETYRPGEPLRPWLYAIARHVRVDHYRKSRRAELHATEMARDAVAGYNPAAEGSRVPEIHALLADLPESQREVITMLKVAGMSLEEVARATASTVGSVKQKAHRAYAKLRERLERTTGGRA